jgi:hypothetical protein
MVDNNTVDTVDGLYGKAASTIAASSEYLVADAGATMWDTTGGQFALSAWIYIDTSSDIDGLFYLVGDTGTNNVYSLNVSYVNALPGPRFTMHDGTISKLVQFSTSEGLVDKAWNHFVIWFDGKQDKYLRGECNGTLVTSSTEFTNDFIRDTQRFSIGSRPYGSAYQNAKVCLLGLWNRPLSTAERAQLYNGGAGITFPFEDTPDPLTSQLKGWWDLDEKSGDRYDQQGNFLLTDINTQGSDEDGKIGRATKGVYADNDEVRWTGTDFRMEGDFSVSFWIKPTTQGASASKSVSAYETTTFKTDWSFEHAGSGLNLSWYLYDSLGVGDLCVLPERNGDLEDHRSAG